ncbi:hypothetical protein CLU86_3943 [Acidovorax sp. 62]|uniref:hypothetical protein n=1 Tax=Acidovorax sp. 62 TaxID=2035203 RepID=UPI000C550EFF|nr:hypothetical protein [Acidovorax sp. 62]PIF92991.1 hypothetical protein CLU86_3943 [Acidovorax sp. 62]
MNCFTPSSSAKDVLVRQFVALLLAASVWFLIGAPLASWMAWHKAESQITALEAKAQQDETISAEALRTAISRIEAEAAATEKTWTAVLCMALGFLSSTGAYVWCSRIGTEVKGHSGTTEP